MKTWISKSFLLCVCILAIAEISMRLFLSDKNLGRFEYGYHPTAGFLEKKDGTVHLVRSGGRKFREQKFSKIPQSNVFRIFVVGDSVVRGPNLQDAYPAVIARALEEHGIKAEAFNLGVGGNGVRRSQIILKQILNYHPNLIILHLNNSNEYEDEREWRRSQEFKSWHPKNWPMKSIVIRRLYELRTEKIMWALLPQQVRLLNSDNDADAKLAAMMNPELLAEWNERVQTITNQSIHLIQQQHIPILIISQCRKRENPPGHFYLIDEGLKPLAESFVQPNVAHLSMFDIYQNLDIKNLFSDSAHMRKAGHLILGKAAAEKILKEKWVQSDPKTPKDR
jgi:hypothetical protein